MQGCSGCSMQVRDVVSCLDYITQGVCWGCHWVERVELAPSLLATTALSVFPPRLLTSLQLFNVENCSKAHPPTCSSQEQTPKATNMPAPFGEFVAPGIITGIAFYLMALLTTYYGWKVGKNSCCLTCSIRCSASCVLALLPCCCCRLTNTPCAPRSQVRYWVYYLMALSAYGGSWSVDCHSYPCLPLPMMYGASLERCSCTDAAFYAPLGHPPSVRLHLHNGYAIVLPGCSTRNCNVDACCFYYQ